MPNPSRRDSTDEWRLAVQLIPQPRLDQSGKRTTYRPPAAARRSDGYIIAAAQGDYRDGSRHFRPYQAYVAVAPFRPYTWHGRDLEKLRRELDAQWRADQPDLPGAGEQAQERAVLRELKERERAVRRALAAEHRNRLNLESEAGLHRLRQALRGGLS